MVGLDRLREVDQLVRIGKSDGEIGIELGIKEDSVRRYRHVLNSISSVEGISSHRVLLFDIETLPMEVLVWGLYKQRINPDSVIRDWCCLGWAAKWLFEPEVVSDILTPKEALEHDDRRILSGIWNLFDEATIVIAHNGDQFDIRKLNMRFLKHGMKPTSPYQSIDTLKASRRAFSASSHKLDYMAQMLCGSAKIQTNYDLWKRCSRGEGDALKEMERYNRQDVRVLEDFYVYIRPWIKSHPNMGVYTTSEFDNHICPTCGSDRTKDSGEYNTIANRYRAFRCLDCGAIGRGRSAVLKQKDKKGLLISVAR
jgi:hypothetical protein